MSENRFAWLQTHVGTFQIMEYLPEEDEQEYGPTVLLYLPLPGRRSLSYNLTALTTEELDKLEELFNLLITEARPIVAERDRIAHEALESGDDSHVRIYRAVPRLFIRKRPSRQDGDRVLNGSQDVPEGTGGDGDSSDGPGGVGDELADGESPDAGTEDDRETPY
jgi:hypothetical protein